LPFSTIKKHYPPQCHFRSHLELFGANWVIYRPKFMLQILGEICSCHLLATVMCHMEFQPIMDQNKMVIS
jgi:hypothetical protein